jgi:AAA+ ATPase superfamily predicted ATPase
MLFDREKELDDLNFVLHESRTHFLTMQGRRRLGKTTLLVEWAKMSKVPSLYWVASRSSATQLLRSFSQAIYRFDHPDAVIDPGFSFPTWEMALQQLAKLARDRQTIVILDEFPYAVEVESALPSLLQNAWDHLLKQTLIFLVLCGSHIGMMEKLYAYQAPLFGRVSGQMRIGPMPFSATRDFLPNYPLDQRVAVYAMLGGVPAYLERFSDRISLAENVRRHLFRPAGIFCTDPQFLLYDELQQPHNYLAVLTAIAAGNHKQRDIIQATGLERITFYLRRLQELQFVRREIPATVPEAKRATSHSGRYDLTDPYLRFYYRFIHPNQHLMEQRLHDWLWKLIGEQLPSYVGLYAFEELCREWVLAKGRVDELPFIPERVGSHWSAKVQVDVVAINWRLKHILLGEAKWTRGSISRSIVRELVSKAEDVVPDDGEGWTIHYAFFARTGFTDAAAAEARRHGALLIDLETLGKDLGAS